MRGALNSWDCMDSFFICLFHLSYHTCRQWIVGLFCGWCWRSQSPQPLRGCPIRGSSVGSHCSPSDSSDQQWALLCPAGSHHSVRNQGFSVSSVFLFHLLDSASWHWIQRQISLFFFLTLQSTTHLFLEMTHFLTLTSGKTQTFQPQPALFLWLSFTKLRIFFPSKVLLPWCGL